MLDEDVELYGELLPHLVFGDYTPLLDNVVRTTGPTESVREFIQTLDRDFPDAADDIKDLIGVSFVENIDDDSPLLTLLGPNLRDVAQEQRTFELPPPA
jgi:hypothetical protein